MKEPEKYDGDDDLDEFDNWLLNTVRWMALHQLGGLRKDKLRVMTLGQFLSKSALEWYNTEIESPHRSQKRWTFEETICELFDRFVHKTSRKVANEKFLEVKYSSKKGVSHLFNEMRKHARRMIEIPTDYEQRKVFMAALPEDMQKMLIVSRGITEERNTLNDIYYNAMDLEEALVKSRTAKEKETRGKPNNSYNEQTRNEYNGQERAQYVPWDKWDRNQERYRSSKRPVIFKKLRTFTRT